MDALKFFSPFFFGRHQFCFSIVKTLNAVFDINKLETKKYDNFLILFYLPLGVIELFFKLIILLLDQLVKVWGLKYQRFESSRYRDWYFYNAHVVAVKKKLVRTISTVIRLFVRSILTKIEATMHDLNFK